MSGSARCTIRHSPANDFRFGRRRGRCAYWGGNFMLQLLTFGTSGALIAAVLLLTRQRPSARARIIRALVIAFCAIGFFRQWLADSIYLVIDGGWLYETYYERRDTLQIILRWGYFSAYSVLPAAAFTRSRTLRNIAGYVTLPFAVASVFFFDDFMAYFTDTAAAGFHWSYGWRAAYFVLELALAVALPILLHVSERHVLRVASFTEWRNFLLGTAGVAVTVMPCYAPQALLGYVQTKPLSFSTYHLVWLGVTLFMALGLYYLFRFRPYSDRYALCLFLVLALFFHYNSLYLTGITLRRLPFQLCNIASYFFLIAIVFKWEKFFHFTFLANTVGTIIALLGPDFGFGGASFHNVHFLYEHTLVLVIPALLAGLRIFRRVDLRSLRPLFLGFTAYFLFCFITGTIINGYRGGDTPAVNYFYMFDLDIAFRYFPFLTFAENYYFTFGRFIVYPIIVSVVYVGFFLLCLLFYMVVRWAYRLEDDHLALRRSGIDLYEKLSGRASRRPKSFVD